MRYSLIVCGVAAGAYGLLLLLLAYLQPDVESTANQLNALVLHPGFTAIQTPWLVAIGAPALAIVVGALLGGLRKTLTPLVVLIIGTALLGAEALLTIVSLGLALLPLVSIGLVATALQYGGLNQPVNARS